MKASEMLDKKIQSVFSKAESFAIFEELGIQKIVSDTNATNSLTDSVPVDEPVDSPYKICNCRWYCGVSQSCSTDCNVEVQECGAFNGSWCTGRCK
jgi:hypothetical protein